jgi:hypothetical protein
MLKFHDQLSFGRLRYGKNVWQREEKPEKNADRGKARTM